MPGSCQFCLFVVRPHLPADLDILDYALQYFKIILLFFLIDPLSYLLDNILVADGGEKLSVAANIILIISNIILSFAFARRWGVPGVAAASVLSKLLFILIISLHFFSRSNTLRLLFVWRWSDFLEIIRSGIVKASIYALEGLSFFLINLFALFYFDEGILVSLAVTEKYLGILTIFIGLSMAAQPLICTLRGENNSKALQSLMRVACIDISSAGVLLSLFTMIFAPFLVEAFGIDEEPLHCDGVIALRIVSTTLAVHAILLLFFIYYYLMNRQKLAFFIGLFKNLISPLVLVVLLCVLTKSEIGIWTGLAPAPILVMIVCAQTIYRRYSKEQFPFLLQTDDDQNIYIFDFVISPGACAEMSHTADEIISTLPVPAKVRLPALYLLKITSCSYLKKIPGKRTSSLNVQ